MRRVIRNLKKQIEYPLFELTEVATGRELIKKVIENLTYFRIAIFREIFSLALL